jgi:rubrerythrin
MTQDNPTPTKIVCIRPDCKSTGEFQYVGEAADIKKHHMTIVDSDGKIVFHKGTYYYKCMSCGATFESEVPPAHKRILYG